MYTFIKLSTCKFMLVYKQIPFVFELSFDYVETLHVAHTPYTVNLVAEPEAKSGCFVTEVRWALGAHRLIE